MDLNKNLKTQTPSGKLLPASSFFGQSVAALARSRSGGASPKKLTAAQRKRREIRQQLFGPDFDLRKATPEQLAQLRSGTGLAKGIALPTRRKKPRRRRPASGLSISAFGDAPSPKPNQKLSS